MTHDLPGLPEGKGPHDMVRVRVRPSNTYGTAEAGAVLEVEAREYIAAHRALELVSDEPPAQPRSVLRAIPTERARELGLPLPAYPGALTTYEVQFWPEDAEAQGLRRREDLMRIEADDGIEDAVKALNQIQAEAGAALRRQEEEARLWIQQREADMATRRDAMEAEVGVVIQQLTKQRDEAIREVERLKSELAALSALAAPPPPGRAEVAQPGRRSR